MNERRSVLKEVLAVMNQTIQLRRWTMTVALVLAIVLGAVGGSALASKNGVRVPILMAANAAGGSGRISFEAGFAPIVMKDLPAVVNVSSSKLVKTNPNSSPFFSDPFFRQFFGNQFSVPREQREHSLGSGVIVNPDGYILTNNHVIEGATDVKVTLADKREFKGKVIGSDAKTDIAVLKIDAHNLPVLTFGDSSKMEPGNFVVAIGNPFGLNGTVTMGIVSATGRGGLGIEDYEDFIQTDAAINPGNSGGALIDEQGDLIGISTAILSGGGGGNEGVGFAIPINMARQVMDQILKNGKVVRAWLGVVIQPVTPDVAKAFGLTEAKGALVGDVTANTPASRAGIEKGDVILQLNGQPIDSSRDLQLKIAPMTPGTTVRLQVFRNGASREISVTLGEMPSQAAQSGGQSGESQNALEGVSVEDLTSDIARQLGLPVGTKGVVVDNVAQGSPADDAGLQRGDVIEQVNRKPVQTAAQFQAALRQAGNQPILLLVNHGGTTGFVVVQPE